jgi:hypothetical protein
MKSKTTILWFMLAAALAMAIWVLNTYFKPASTAPKPLLAGLRADQVGSLQIIPADSREISVVRTNGGWRLASQLVYPAQTAAIDGLLGTLEKLVPTLAISAAELNAHKDAEAEFGFDHPQFLVEVTAGDQTWHLRVGHKTANGDGVYVRVVGATGAFITDLTWLQFLPHEAKEWRDTSLVNVPDVTDWLVITNGAQAIELRRDPTNRLWRLVRPLPARANNLLVSTVLGNLRNATVARFVSDDPKADLTAYGLEPAALDVWLGSGTNLLTAVHTGTEVKDFPGEVYARRQGWNSVLATAKSPLADLRKASAIDFRDPILLDLTAPVTEIQLRGRDTYTLQFNSNAWTVVGEKFPVEADLVTNSLLRPLASKQVTEFVRDSVTPADLQTYGFSNVVQTITLRAGLGGTRPVIGELLVGGSTTNGLLYVKRSDEEFIYTTPDFGNDIPANGDYFRARQLWHFSETNVAQVTMRQGDQIRQVVRNGTNDWTLGPGSQGMIEPHAIEETVHQLGDLAAYAWLGRNWTDAAVGISTNSPVLTIELKSGEKHTVTFGQRYDLGPDQSTALAEVTLDGQRWYFIFPRMQLVLVAERLAIIPPDKPASATPAAP